MQHEIDDAEAYDLSCLGFRFQGKTLKPWNQIPEPKP